MKNIMGIGTDPFEGIETDMTGELRRLFQSAGWKYLVARMDQWNFKDTHDSLHGELSLPIEYKRGHLAGRVWARDHLKYFVEKELEGPYEDPDEKKVELI